MNREQSSGFDSQKTSEIASMMRAFGILYNTGLTYQTSHAVFLRSVEERMPLFEAALKGVPEISVFFSEGQVRCGAQTLDAGLAMFRDLSQKFEKLNVTGLVFLPGLSSMDLKKFIGILVTKANEIQPKGLQSFLDHEGVKAIREKKGKIGLIQDHPAPARTPGAAPVAEAKSKATLSGARKADTMTWDIAAGSGAEASDEGFPAEGQDSAASGERVFRGYVRDVLHSVEERRTSASQATESITNRFTEILEDRIADVRKESEVKIRRLNTIKDIILKEMESHHLAAVVCDTSLNIIAANESGRRIVGNAPAIVRGSSLEQFISSGLERQVIELEGVPRVAHVILSVEPISKDGAMLISIE